MKISNEEISQIIEEHRKWMNAEKGGQRINYRGIDLSGVDLHGLNLVGAVLPDTNFSNANLEGTNLYASNLSGSNFTKANLSNINLSNSNLTDTNMTEANLFKANLEYSDMTGATFRDTNFAKANLYKTCLDGTTADESLSKIDNIKNNMGVIMKSLVDKEQLATGWSADKKFHAVDSEGHVFLLRTSNIAHFEKKRYEYEIMNKFAQSGVSMCTPLEFGTGEDIVYSIQAWIEGENARNLIPNLANNDHYQYGFKAGKELKKIHSVSVSKADKNWEELYNQKLDRRIKRYEENPLHFDEAEEFIKFINENRYLLKNRPISFLHGDYHIGNVMIDFSKNVHVIDFENYSYGDPWNDFRQIIITMMLSHEFASGTIDGYFDNNVPKEFWNLMAMYITSDMLHNICFDAPFGKVKIDAIREKVKNIYDWYDGMKSVIPNWYLNKL